MTIVQRKLDWPQSRSAPCKMAHSFESGSAPGSTSRARVHGEFLRLWESNAPLTDSQIALCQKLEAAVSTAKSELKPSSDIAADNVDANEGPKAYLGADGLKGLVTVSTAEEFHAWHNEMERRLEEANNDKFRRIISELEEDRAKAVAMLDTVSGAEDALSEIRVGRAEVAAVTDQFRQDCETMVAERKRMAELADALRKRLAYFEELETLTERFGGGKGAISPTHPEFVKLLHRLDECVAYASSSTGAVADADGYLARFLELQRRAFSMVRDHTVTLLRDTATQIAKELREERASVTTFRQADLSDAAKEYLRFRTIAGGVKSFMTELHSRAKSPVNKPGTPGSARRRSSMRGASDPYTSGAGSNVSGMNTNPLFSTRSTALSLYSDCEECFFEQRKRLVDPSVSAHIKSLADDKNMIALARLGSSYVLRVCQMERQLYDHFFPSESLESNGGDSPVLLSALKSICNMVYSELRPLILQEYDLDKLVYLIEVLKTEILGDEVPRRGAAGASFIPSAQRAVADAQERIIYRAEVYLRDEIRGFQPTPAHLDYPERLLRQKRMMVAASGLPSVFGESQVAEATTVAVEEEDTVEPLIPPDTRTEEEKATEEAEFKNGGIYSAWYPPVERTLRLLSMLYRCVDARVFAGVAQESVAACVQLVSNAASRIEGTGKPDAADHAQLFLVWQLLMTREQISPFDVEMSYTEHELDFSDLRSLLGSVIRGRLSFRSLAAPPAVRQKVVDSKRELDHRVRAACESFILKTTRLLLDPVLAFLAKCNALPASARAPTNALKEGEEPPTPPPAPFETLKHHTGSFADPERLRATWQTVLSAVDRELPKIVERMKIYIAKSASRAVLLRPVRANIAEAATELLSAVQTRYTLEERAKLGIDGGEVRRLLDRVEAIMGIGPRTPSVKTPPSAPTPSSGASPAQI